jgi:hypothetical protein
MHLAQMGIGDKVDIGFGKVLQKPIIAATTAEERYESQCAQE